ncbi:hypothetical protein PL10110_1090027 [Planktothrix agardhii]|nr:hypothetical protein PL10110_1090027 [Planktothrix agardhii]
MIRGAEVSRLTPPESFGKFQDFFAAFASNITALNSGHLRLFPLIKFV